MRDKKLKVLFYNTDLRGGGAEKILVNIANHLHEKGHDVTVGTFFKEGVNREFLNPDIKQFWAMESPFRAYRILALALSPKKLYQNYIAPQGKFDLVVSFLEGFPSRIISGAPKEQASVSWIHLELYPDTVGREFRSVKEAKACYETFNKIIYVAGTVQDCFEKCIPVRTNQGQVIYNPLETKEIIRLAGQDSENPYPNSNFIKLVTVGRLNPQKGYDRLLRIIKKLQDDKLEFHLYILGSGPMEQELKKFCSENYLTAKVTFVGFLKNPYPYIKNADLFICSSRKEGYSTVVTESVILETPVITTDCSGMAEILEDGKAGVIVNNDEESLYQGLKYILQNPIALEKLQIATITRSQFIQKRDTYQEVEDLLFEIKD